ncbi:MAG TPA: orotate phosphoribosyltransferase [Candidatus Hypogeohydataceae bacterium YC41]
MANINEKGKGQSMLGTITGSYGLDSPQAGAKCDRINYEEKGGLCAELLRLLYELSFRESGTPITLASGRKSNYYICKDAQLSSKGMGLVGDIVYEKIKELNVHAVGGLETGAVFIAFPTAMVARTKGKELNVFVVRKELKGHGIPKKIEGKVEKGDKVVVVDDVMTSGESVLKAINAAKEFGLDVVKVIVLVDRQEGGKEVIEETGIPIEAIFTMEEILQLHDERQ